MKRALGRTTMLVMVFVLACSDALAPIWHEPTPPQESVATVTLAPVQLTLVRGASGTLRATVLGTSGRELPGRRIDWSSGDAAVASVANDGAVVANGVGTTVVTAVSEGKSGRATITVTPERLPVSTVEIQQGDEMGMSPGTTVRLDAIARAADGSVLADRTAEWSSNGPAIVAVSASGLAEAIEYGTAVLSATVEGKTARLTVSVSSRVARLEITPPSPVIAVGESQQLVAQAYEADDRPITRAITWTSSNEAVASVSASGVVTGRLNGLTTITATTEGKSRSVEVLVVTRTQHALVGINQSPLPYTFTSTETDGAGEVRTVSWMVREGSLRLGSDGRFEQQVGVWVYTDRSPGDQVTYGYQGIYQRDYVTGELVFYEGEDRPLFTGRLAADGTVTVTRRMRADLPELVFHYAAP